MTEIQKRKPRENAANRHTPQHPRFPGIVADAAALGVTRMHLTFVLKGERKSPGLLARYKTLKAQSPSTPPPPISKTKSPKP